MNTKKFYRVKPQRGNYASENYNELERAVKRAENRNKVKPSETQLNPDSYTRIEYGHDCKVFEVIEVSTEVKI